MASPFQKNSTQITRWECDVIYEDALSIRELCSQLQEDSGARVWVLLGDRVRGRDRHQVRIRGESGSVAVAKYEVEKLIDQRKRISVMDVKVDQQKIEKIIGKYRENRRAIEKETGAEIFVVGERVNRLLDLGELMMIS